MRFFVLWACLTGIASTASARVFQMGGEHFASYLRGSYQIAAEGDDPYKLSGGTGISYDSSYTANWSYEFGFIYSTQQVNLRFGLEVLKPTDLKDMKGTDAGGSTIYTLTNSISGYVPKVGIEANLKTWPTSRWYLNGDVGWATVTVQNSYTFTAGQTTFPGQTDFREEVKGTAMMTEYSTGFETLLSDTTTIVLDVGYRILNIDSFSHNLDVTNFQGTVAKGADATNTDGSARTLNLSGAFASVWLRFWLN